MRKLVITQTKENNVKETVPTAVVNKLYNLGKLDDSNHIFTYGVDTSNVKRPITTVSGAIIIPVAYMRRLEYLATKYPNLDITSNLVYIDFEDPNIESALINANIGDGTGITPQDAASASLGIGFFKNNTSITKFNEFKYFTTTNTSSVSLNELFYGATNLSLIDLSEIIVIHKSEFRNTKITTVNAPKLSTYGTKDTCTHIFADCTSLTSVQSLGSVDYIPNASFIGCTSLATVTLPEECLTIEGDAFKEDSALTTISMSYDMLVIDTSAFHNCNNLVLDISNFNKILKFGSNAFAHCYNVTGIINVPNYTNNDFLGFQATKVSKLLCAGMATRVGGLEAQNSSNARLTEVYLPYECIRINSSAFKNLIHLTTVKLYSTSVLDWQEGETPTYLSDLSKITFFGGACFSNCPLVQSLTGADLINAVTIEWQAFQSSSLSGTINCPNLVNLGNLAFKNTRITSVTSLGSVTTLAYSIFENCTLLTSVSGISRIDSIGPNVFNGCQNLTTIGLNTIYAETLSQGIFCNCLALEGELNFPNAVTMSSNDYGRLFLNCIKLTKLTFGHIKSLLGGSSWSISERGHFTGCTGLKVVDLGDSLEELGLFNFYNCNSLKAIIINNSTPPAFHDCPTNSYFTEDKADFRTWFGNDNVLIYVPDAARYIYETATGFSLFASGKIFPLSEYNETTIMNS